MTKKMKPVKKMKKSSSLKKTNLLKAKGRKKPIALRKKRVSPIPKGYHSITPYLIVNQAVQAIEFYKTAFGAKELIRMEHPKGKIKHAELKIGDSKIMLTEVCADRGTHSPQDLGGSPVGMHLYIKNVDAVVEHAVAAGAKLLQPVEDMFYGDRSGMLEDPYGHQWCISTHIEDVSIAEAKKRAAKTYKGVSSDK
jgi:PhnB protein